MKDKRQIQSNKPVDVTLLNEEIVKAIKNREYAKAQCYLEIIQNGK